MGQEPQTENNEPLAYHLSVEDILGSGRIPLDVVTDALFGTETKGIVVLTSNFDPIPLRRKLINMGCEITPQKVEKGWCFQITPTTHSQNPETETKDRTEKPKVKFEFSNGIITVNVLDFDYPTNFLEVLRFMDTSLDGDIFRVEIKGLSNKFRNIFQERGWSCVTEKTQSDHLTLLLEKT